MTFGRSGFGGLYPSHRFEGLAERSGKDNAVVNNYLLSVRHVRLQALWEYQLAAIPIEASPRENQFGTVVEILQVGIGKLCAFPANGFASVEQAYPAAY